MKRQKPPESKDAARRWHVARCRRCNVVRAAVEVGEGDRLGLSVMVDAGYLVAIESGPVEFRPHPKECR